MALAPFSLLNIKRFSILLFCLTLLCLQVAKAQPKKKTWAKQLYDFYSDSTKDASKGLVPLPYIFYTPDTRWAAGAIGVYYFKLRKDQFDTLTRLSYVKFLADYTQNRQFDAWGSWNVFLSEENWLLKGELRYRLFPDRYYGIGPRSDKSNEEKFSYELMTFKKLVMRKIYPRMFLGLDYQVTRYYNVVKASQGELASGTVTGSQGSVNSGIGIVYTSDRRDNIFNSTKGHFFEFSSYFYEPAWGSEFQFSNYNINFSKYHPLGSDWVLGWQVSSVINDGQVPFYNLAAVGGEEILRGYARNRFRDLNFAGAQAELRIPLFWRIGAVVFAGAGEVFRKPDQIEFNRLKYSFGSGLRIKVNRKENLNIRLDYGIGRDGNSAFYFAVGEAF
jgi:hypothetical protein